MTQNKKPDLSIHEAQDLVDQWIRKYGVRYFNELTNLAILTEEVGEVARIVARIYGDQSFKKSEKNHTDVLADELADVLFVLICLANQTGIDLTEAFDKNIRKKTIRDATRHKRNSKLSHSKPEQLRKKEDSKLSGQSPMVHDRRTKRKR